MRCLHVQYFGYYMNYSKYWESQFVSVSMLFKSHPEVRELKEVRTFPTKALGRFELAEILPSLQIGRAVENCSLALRLSLLGYKIAVTQVTGKIPGI